MKCGRRWREGSEKEGKCCWKFWARNEMKWGFAMVILKDWLWFDNALIMGPTRSLYLPLLPLKLSFQLLKTSKFFFRFPSPKLKFLSFEWWKQMSKTKPNTFICGTHEFWTIGYGNWVISLSFFQSKQPLRACLDAVSFEWYHSVLCFHHPNCVGPTEEHLFGLILDHQFHDSMTQKNEW